MNITIHPQATQYNIMPTLQKMMTPSQYLTQLSQLNTNDANRYQPMYAFTSRF